MKTSNKTLLVMGTTLLTGLTSVTVQADSIEAQGSIFQMTELSSGYMQLAAAEATTDTTKATPKDKTPEAKCAGNKPISEPKTTEGKCGEGKCGNMKEHKAATEGAKATTADTTKAAEGKCGDMKKEATPDAAKAKSGADKATDTGAVKK